MTVPDQKSEIRALLDASLVAIELDLRECVPVRARCDDVVKAIRELITAERALADGDVRPTTWTDEEDAAALQDAKDEGRR